MRRWAILVFSVLCLMEMSAYLAGSYLRSLPGRGIFYTPHVKETYREYLSRMDPGLGWPSPSSFGRGDFDSSGSRIIPAFPDPAVGSCVSIYGDSFAWGTEVDNEQAWSNQLSKLLGCRAANYGVPAYGTDQAYLRFHANAADKAPVVLLCHLSEGITRNVGQLRNLAAPSPLLFLKPRFILDDKGRLELVPVPHLDENSYRDLQENPRKYLSHEFFLPGGDSGIEELKFPYMLSMLRLYKRLYVANRILGKPRYSDFYNARHPARGLEVTEKILDAFHAEALSRNKRPIVVVFPTKDDIGSYKKIKQWVYAPLLDHLKAGGIEFLDVGQEFAGMGETDPEKLYGDLHFSPYGNRLVAQIIYKHLRSENLVSSSRADVPK